MGPRLEVPMLHVRRSRRLMHLKTDQMHRSPRKRQLQLLGCLTVENLACENRGNEIHI